MMEFKSNIKLGGTAFAVSGNLDYYIRQLTVGQVRITMTIPKARVWDDDKLFVEEYMCIETGVGSGRIWTYGSNIFNNEDDAKAAVIKHQQAAYKQRAEREKYQQDEAERKRKLDLITLQELKAKYEKESEC